jgi:protein-S-isoprenylcysteine O-methyltransferase Ste14
MGAEVAKPGKYDYTGDTTVIQAVNIAGGFTDKARRGEVLLFRRVSDQWAEVKKIDIQRMLKKQDLTEDLHLRPGDMVLVSQSPMSKIARFIPIPTVSRYAERYLPWPHPEQEQVSYLLDLCERYGLNGWALFPSDDETAASVARRHSTLATRFRLTTPPWDTLRWAYDKRCTYEVAASLGIDQPPTFFPRNRDEAAALDCSFPVILKPHTRNTSMHSRMRSLRLTILHRLCWIFLFSPGLRGNVATVMGLEATVEQTIWRGPNISSPIMCATSFEFKYRDIIIRTIYLAAVLSYVIDPQMTGSMISQWFSRNAGFLSAIAWERVVLSCGVLLVFLAAAIRSWATAYLRYDIMRHPNIQTDRLICDGPFGWTRNPLYLGNLFMVAGVSLMLSPTGASVLIVGSLALIHRLVRREETELARTHGPAFEKYCRTVSRWRPAFRSGSASAQAPPLLDGVVGELLLWIIAIAMTTYVATFDLRIFGTLLICAFVPGACRRLQRRGFMKRRTS